MKPRVRVKARYRMYGRSVPDDAVPGDLVVGNRGAAARIVEIWTSSGLSSCLTTDYLGNYFEGARPNPGCKTYNFSGFPLVPLRATVRSREHTEPACQDSKHSEQR
jgi:hypothetical protein